MCPCGAMSVKASAMRPFLARPNSEDLLVLAGMIAAGQVRPVVERRFPLARIAEALAHVAAGHVQGTTVVEVAQC